MSKEDNDLYAHVGTVARWPRKYVGDEPVSTEVVERTSRKVRIETTWSNGKKTQDSEWIYSWNEMCAQAIIIVLAEPENPPDEPVT